MFLFSGFIDIQGNISFASQVPWLFPATVRQNILFGEEYVEERYDEVVRVCALEYDFSVLEKGDLTVVSDNGQNFSKGQQCRINLARAIYRDTNIYLLDDCLAALDAHVQQHIFEECISNFLKGKIVIFVSQNSAHIHKADKVLILNDQQREIRKDYIGEETANDESNVFTPSKHHRTIDEIRYRRKTLSETEAQQQQRNIYREVKKQGSVATDVYSKYIQCGGGYMFVAFIILTYIGSQFCDSYADKLLSKW